MYVLNLFTKICVKKLANVCVLLFFNKLFYAFIVRELMYQKGNSFQSIFSKNKITQIFHEIFLLASKQNSLVVT